MGATAAVALLGMLPAFPAAVGEDPSWSSVSSLYPLLAHSREGLGVADHAAAAALEQAKEDDPICTVVFPTQPPACSSTAGACATDPSTIGSAFFSLELYSAGSRTNFTFGLNCSHSSSRALIGFAPIVVATGPPAPVRGGGSALHHDPAARNSCAEMAPTCPVDAPHRYGNDEAGWYCCQSEAGAKAEDCKIVPGLCCLVPGHSLGCQGHPACVKNTWTEYGNDCAGWYCSLATPTTTKYCERPDICSGCPNTAQCRSNCTGSGTLTRASCDCVDNGGVCRLLSHRDDLSASTTTAGKDSDMPVCVAATRNAQNLTEDIKQSIKLKQTVFAATEGMSSNSTLTVYMQLEVSLVEGGAHGMAGELSVAATLTGSSATLLHWPAQPLKAGSAALSFAAGVDVADSGGRCQTISPSLFANNLNMTADYWKTKLASASGPEIGESRVATAWKAWLS